MAQQFCFEIYWPLVCWSKKITHQRGRELKYIFDIWQEKFESVLNYSVWRRRLTDGWCNKAVIAVILHTHTVSFDWFLSGLELCLLKRLIFYQKLFWNIRSRLNLSTFWFFEPAFRYIWSKSSFLFKKLHFLSNISKLGPKKSKCGRVKPSRSDIALYFLVNCQKF